MKRFESTYWLIPILILGAILRFNGLRFGLPELWHPDEDALITPIISMLKTGDLEPTRLEYGSLHLYILLVASAVTTVFSIRDGAFESPLVLENFERGTYPAVFPHPEYVLTGRIVSALMSVGIIFLIYLLAKRFGNTRQGLLAALIFAIIPAIVIDGHFATTDSPLMFWVTLALLLLVRAYDDWETDGWPAYAGAGFVCGLATSTKYNGVLLIVPLILTMVLRTNKLEDLISLRSISGMVGMGVGFIVGTPYALLNLPKFIEWFGYSLRVYNRNYVPTAPSWVWHLEYQLTSSHVIIFVLGWIGLILCLKAYRQRALILGAHLVIFWFVIFSQSNYQARMWYPTAPLLVVFAAFAIERGFSNFLATRRDSLKIVVSLFFIGYFLYMGVTAFLFGQRLHSDVRLETKYWIEQNVSEGTQIAVDYFHPNLNEELWTATKLFYLYDEPFEWYQEQSIEYLIMSEALNDFGRLGPDSESRYLTLTSQLCGVESIESDFLGSSKQTMTIYKMPPCD